MSGTSSNEAGSEAPKAGTIEPLEDSALDAVSAGQGGLWKTTSFLTSDPAAAADGSVQTYHRAKSFQIISAGRDGQF